MYRLFKFNHPEIYKSINVFSKFNTYKNLINTLRKNFFKKTNYLCKKDYYSKREYFNLRNSGCTSERRPERNKKGVFQTSKGMASRC